MIKYYFITYRIDDKKFSTISYRDKCKDISPMEFIKEMTPDNRMQNRTCVIVSALEIEYEEFIEFQHEF